MLTAIPEPTAAGFDALISALAASPIAAVCVVLVWIFVNHINKQTVATEKRQEERDRLQRDHEQRMATQYTDIAKAGHACISENTQVLREFVKKEARA